MDSIKEVAQNSLQNSREKKIREYSKIKKSLQDDIREHLWRNMKRNPMILPVIMEVE